jgi:hypothetical protein
VAETLARYAWIMFRALRDLPGLVADYTVGTLIVLVQLTIRARNRV